MAWQSASHSTCDDADATPRLRRSGVVGSITKCAAEAPRFSGARVRLWCSAHAIRARDTFAALASHAAEQKMHT